MPTQAQIQATILSASYKNALLMTANNTKLAMGNNNVLWAEARLFNRNIIALGYQYQLEDYTSDQTIAIYDVLNSLIGIDTSTITIDPNYQAPNTNIIVDVPPDNVITVIKSQNDLIEDGVSSGNWYLPFLDANGQPFANGVVPIQITVNGVGIAIQINYAFTPVRLYGFANNSTQSIILSVI